MQLLETSQIIFNFVAAFAVIIVAILISVIAFDIIRFIKATKKVLNAISRESAELHAKINKLLEWALKIPFFSNFFEKAKKKSKAK